MSKTIAEKIDTLRSKTHNKDTHSLLQLQMLMFNVDLMDFFESMSTNLNEDLNKRMIEIIEELLKLHEVISRLPSSTVDEAYHKEEVSRLDAKYNEVFSEITRKFFNQEPGEA